MPPAALASPPELGAYVLVRLDEMRRGKRRQRWAHGWMMRASAGDMDIYLDFDTEGVMRGMDSDEDPKARPVRFRVPFAADSIKMAAFTKPLPAGAQELYDNYPINLKVVTQDGNEIFFTCTKTNAQNRPPIVFEVEAFSK